MLLGCAAAPREAAKTAEGAHFVEGLVSLDGRGFEGATVHAYLASSFSGGKEPEPAATAPSAQSGRFELQLPEGSYFITAGAEGKFAYFGRNPVKTGSNSRGISLPLVPKSEMAAQSVPEGDEGVWGRVLHDGKAVEKVVVMAHLRADTGFRGQPYAMSAPTGPDGSYALKLEPGSYFVTAKKRASGLETGPLASGDLFGVLPSLPLEISKGISIKDDIHLIELPSPEQQGRFKTRWAKVEGLVADGAGKPAAGFRACLYKNPKMLGEPEFISAPTGPDGKFSISVSAEGRFYLGARQRLGGPPQSGELVGFMQGAEPEGLLLEAGATLSGITVKLSAAP